MSYRFRVDEGKLVLQVLVKRDCAAYGWQRDPEWRDATVEDIPVADPFRSERTGVCEDGIGWNQTFHFRASHEPIPQSIPSADGAA